MNLNKITFTSNTDSTQGERVTEQNDSPLSLEMSPEENTDNSLPEETLLDSSDAYRFAPGK